MTSSNAAKAAPGGRQLTYRLDPKVTVTRRQAGTNGGAGGAFLKHGESGRLFRLGPEELHLLTELDAGRSLAEIAVSFQKAFGKAVRPQTVESFARQMLGAGVLRQVEEAEAEELLPVPVETPAPAVDAPEDTSPDDAAVTVSGEADDGGDDDLSDDDADERGDRLDDDFNQLEDMIFGDDGGASDTSAEQPKAGAPGPDPEPAEERAMSARAGIADPMIAARKVKFKPDAGGGDEKKTKVAGMMVRLFDPTPMLAALSSTFGWWGRVGWLLYPLVAFAALSVLHRLSEFGLAIGTGLHATTRIGFILISLLTVNLFTRLVTAVVIHRRGGAVKHFGLTFLLFIIPRFAIDNSGVQKLDREGKLAVYSATIKARLFLFAVATIIWAVTRRSGTMIPDIAMVVEQLSLLTFLITAMPLSQGDGYKWMSTYFNQPLLRQRAFNYVFGTSKQIAQHLPEPTKGEKWAFTVYAIGSALFTGLVLSLIVIYATTALEGRFGGTGLVIFAGVIGLLFVWVSVMKKGQREAMKSAMAERMAEARQSGGGAGAGAGGMGGMMGRGGGGGAGLPVPVGQGGALMRRPGTAMDRPRAKPLTGVYADNSALQRRNRWISRMVVVAVLSTLAYVAFLPYSYEVGGDFTILPDQRTSVNARISGELVDIYIDEGDVVEEGQLLARLSDWRPLHDVAAAKAELEKAQARLQKLQDGASEEEIQVAREQVAAAEADIPFKKAQAERAQTLLEKGAISDTEAERFQAAYVSAVQALRTAQANLAKIEAPAGEADLRIAEADVARLASDLEYNMGILAAVEIKAPVAGRIVTENVQLVRGKYMEAGELFVEIENHEVARAEVMVSETDIGLVEPGDTVRLKAWASSEAERIGRVIAVAPQAETEEFGRVVRVKTQFENANGFFRPGMTGFAKIDGQEMPAWQAFTRLFDRFFRIEVWGWIP